MTDDLLEDLTGDELIDGFKDLLHNLDDEIRTFNQLRTDEKNMPRILASGVHILTHTCCIKDWHVEMESRGWNPPEEWPHKNYAEAISKWILEENQRENVKEDNSFLRSVGISIEQVDMTGNADVDKPHPESLGQAIDEAILKWLDAGAPMLESEATPSADQQSDDKEAA